MPSDDNHFHYADEIHGQHQRHDGIEAELRSLRNDMARLGSIVGQLEDSQETTDQTVADLRRDLSTTAARLHKRINGEAAR